MTESTNTSLDEFTPGPWRVEPEIDGYPAGRMTRVFTDEDRGRRQIASTYNQTRAHIQYDFESAEANARLIAAAPDMYVALVAESEFWHHAFNCPNCEPESATYCDEVDFDAALNQRRAAIRKAEGTQS